MLHDPNVGEEPLTVKSPPRLSANTIQEEPLALKRDQPQTDRLVSLVVTSRNEREDIENCLKSLLNQDYPSIEVILVDNASTDGTVEVADRLSVRVENRGPERSAQRNHGFFVSRGEYVCFLDADMIAPPNMATECVARLADSSIGAVVIPEDSFGEGFWTRCKILERSCYSEEDAVEAARFYRASVFETLNGFDEDLTGLEDLDLSQRCAERWKQAHSTSPIRHHEGTLSILDQMHKKFRYGKLSSQYVLKHPAAFRKQARVLRPGFLRNSARLARTPWLSACMLWLKTCEIAAGGMGILAGLLRHPCRSRRQSTGKPNGV